MTTRMTYEASSTYVIRTVGQGTRFDKHKNLVVTLRRRNRREGVGRRQRLKEENRQDPNQHCRVVDVNSEFGLLRELRWIFVWLVCGVIQHRSFSAL